MAKKNKITEDKPINIGLKSIEVSNYLIKNPIIALEPNHVFSYNFVIQHKVSFDDKIIVVIATVNIFETPEKKNLFCSLTANFGFNVGNLEDFTIEADGKKSIVTECLIIVNALTISSLRGILYEKNKGTFLHNVYVPIVDASKFVHENLIEKNSE